MINTSHNICFNDITGYHNHTFIFVLSINDCRPIRRHQHRQHAARDDSPVAERTRAKCGIQERRTRQRVGEQPERGRRGGIPTLQVATQLQNLHHQRPRRHVQPPRRLINQMYL